MVVDKIDLILEIVKKVDEKVDTLKNDNSDSHAILFTKIDNVRNDVNGLKLFRAKVLGMAAVIAVIISWLFKKL